MITAERHSIDVPPRKTSWLWVVSTALIALAAAIGAAGLVLFPPTNASSGAELSAGSNWTALTDQSGMLAIGGVIIIAIAWSLFAFGLAKLQTLVHRDMGSSGPPAPVRSAGKFTEVWISQPVSSGLDGYPGQKTASSTVLGYPEPN